MKRKLFLMTAVTLATAVCMFFLPALDRTVESTSKTTQGPNGSSVKTETTAEHPDGSDTWRAPWVDHLLRNVPSFGDEFSGNTDYAMGSVGALTIYTPADITASGPITTDGPCAGYTYAGLFFQQARRNVPLESAFPLASSLLDSNSYSSFEAFELDTLALDHHRGKNVSRPVCQARVQHRIVGQLIHMVECLRCGNPHDVLSLDQAFEEVPSSRPIPNPAETYEQRMNNEHASNHRITQNA